jgi:hypothetical protein
VEARMIQWICPGRPADECVAQVCCATLDRELHRTADWNATAVSLPRSCGASASWIPDPEAHSSGLNDRWGEDDDPRLLGKAQWTTSLQT